MPREKYMVSANVLTSDRFQELEFSAQALYMQLLVSTDTVGGVSGAKRIIRMGGYSTEDLESLKNAGLVIPVDTGDETIWFITDYFIHNKIDMQKIARDSGYFDIAREYLALNTTTRRMALFTDTPGDEIEELDVGLTMLAAKRDATRRKQQRKEYAAEYMEENGLTPAEPY